MGATVVAFRRKKRRMMVVGRRRFFGWDAMGGGRTRVFMRGRRFSFPLRLLLMNADFFHVNTGIPPLLTSPGEALSTREKVLVKVKIVNTDAGHLAGCHAGCRCCYDWCMLVLSNGDGGMSQSPTLLALEKALIFDLRRCGRSGILYVDTGRLLHFQTRTRCVAHERQGRLALIRHRTRVGRCASLSLC
jgi:hypothetical protein